MQTLEPLTLKDRYYAAVEAEIRRILEDLIYRPLLAIINVRINTVKRKFNAEIRNSLSALRYAISTGDIWYEDGQFKGKFNARTSAAIIKLGGKFNGKTKSYKLARDKVPVELKFAQNEANARYEEMRLKILSTLDNIDVNKIDLMSQLKEEYESTLTHMEGDLHKTIPQKAPSAISQIAIEAVLTDAQKSAIAKDWSQNLELYIKGWTQDNILKLRQQIQPHVMAGGRAEGLVKVLEENYGVATRKAKFLARQETALLMSKFQETRYSDMGIKKYRWSTAHDEKVRKDHKALDGKIFAFDLPPVTDRRSGARNNPGQDFNCRCVAIPLFD